MDGDQWRMLMPWSSMASLSRSCFSCFRSYARAASPCRRRRYEDCGYEDCETTLYHYVLHYGEVPHSKTPHSCYGHLGAEVWGHTMGSGYGVRLWGQTMNTPHSAMGSHYGPLWATMGSTMGSFKALAPAAARAGAVAHGRSAHGRSAHGHSAHGHGLARALHPPRTCHARAHAPRGSMLCATCAREAVPRSPTGARTKALPCPAPSLCR